MGDFILLKSRREDSTRRAHPVSLVTFMSAIFTLLCTMLIIVCIVHFEHFLRKSSFKVRCMLSLNKIVFLSIY